MTKLFRSMQRLMGIVAFLLSLSACATYRGAAIEGRVVDAETQQPVKDVVVVVEWKLYGGFWQGSTLGRLLLQEAVTDEQGRYRFPSWGPLHASEGEIDRTAPTLNFYKRGYKFTVQENENYVAPYVKMPDPLISEWDGKTLELEPFKDEPSRESYYKELIGASHLYSLDEEKCAWQEIPRMTAELIKRELEYQAKGTSASVPTRNELHRNGKCADPEQFLKGYLK